MVLDHLTSAIQGPPISIPILEFLRSDLDSATPKPLQGEVLLFLAENEAEFDNLLSHNEKTYEQTVMMVC